MIRLTPLPGNGRLFRVDDYVVFSTAHDPELIDALSSAADLFKALAEYIVTSSFDVTDLVVVDVELKAAMLFGDITLVTGSDRRYSAVQRSTWLEVDLAGEEFIAAQLGAAQPNLELNLESGYVAAGGFALSLVSAEEVEDRHLPITQTDESLEDRPVLPTSSFEQQAADVIGSEPEAVAEEGAPPMSDAWRPSAAHEVPADFEDPELFDPLADPSRFDLERLGSEPSVMEPILPVAGAVPENEGVGESEQEAVALDARLTPELDRQPVIPAPPVAPATPVTASEAPVAQPVIPPPPIVPPPTPENGAETILPPPVPVVSTPKEAPGPDPMRVAISFDDGQTVQVVAGLYVGRHPKKTGLPEMYDAVTIRSEEVSRRHWQLVISDGRAVVSDLGSAAGTRVERSGQLVEESSEGTEVYPGDRIRFADRWADVE